MLKGNTSQKRMLLSGSPFYNHPVDLAGEAMPRRLRRAILIVLGVLASLGATLTMPGIAGIVLTVGMAVDAHILIFERMREELKLGKTLVTAGEEGLARTWSVADGSGLENFKGHIGGAVKAVAFAGGAVISAGSDGKVIAWDTQPEWKLVRTIGSATGASPITGISTWTKRLSEARPA